MRAPRRLLAVLLFAAVGLLALAFSGLFSWISSVLFLLLELLAESLRPLIGRRREQRRRSPARSRSLAGELVHRGAHPRRHGRPRSLPARLREGAAGPHPSPPLLVTPTSRVLVPLEADRPGLLAFALDECRHRRAELHLLFLRPLAVTPMGPNPVPSLAEDEQARTVFDRLGTLAEEAGVPIRTLYQVTHDVPATILETARAVEANVVVMEASRRNLFWRALWGDEIQAILMHLPERISLVLHTST
jgi:nucleotide-binding universal stress UspA family protein